VASGHGIGKSALVSWMLLQALCTFPQTTLKQFRHVCTRFDLIALNYLAMAKLAAVRLWLGHYESAA
jgi:transposase